MVYLSILQLDLLLDLIFIFEFDLVTVFFVALPSSLFFLFQFLLFNVVLFHKDFKIANLTKSFQININDFEIFACK